MPEPSAIRPEPSAIWQDALRVIALLVAAPHVCGGVVIRAGAGPVRDRWLNLLRAAMPPAMPLRRMPPSIADDRLLGGLDLAATLRAGRPVAQSGLLADADGGLIVAPMAERLPAGTIARLCAALDTGTVTLARDGLQSIVPARCGLIALDEGVEDEAVAAALADRLAFHLDLSGLALRDTDANSPGVSPKSEALLHFVEGDGVDTLRDDANVEGDAVAALCAASADLGIESLRGPLLATRIARLIAGLEGRSDLTLADAAQAARLVLAPRATRLPATEPPAEAESDQRDQDRSETPDPGTEPPPSDENVEADQKSDASFDEIVVEAARAAIPPNLLAQMLAGGPRLQSRKAGRMGAAGAAPRKGRPAGSRAGDPRRGQLDLIATLRAAAPWQRLRRGSSNDGQTLRRVIVLPDDLRIRKLVQQTETTTIFCVDASGSAAMERLAEAKGAVELLLAEAYVRRDRVALVAFRGALAEVVLPPTRSLVRAKRALSGLPGGGGTPLAAGLDAAATLALSIRRGGGSPVLVVLTDGRANVARSGEGGRARAVDDALAAGRLLRSLDLPALVIDTGTRPDGARRLAEAAQARYIPLPFADAGGVSAAVRAAIR